MYGIAIEDDNCYWNGVFDMDAINTLITGWVISGRVAFFLVLWLNLILWCTTLRYDPKYRNLAAFTTVMNIRRGYQYIFYFFELMQYDWLLDLNNCSTYGFLETFLGVYEVESLTHVCIERYVVAKYIANDWAIKQWHYTLYPCLCLFFSLLYSLSPFFGIGSYAQDFTCLTCTYNMVLPDSWERYVMVTIYLLRSVKPLFFMLIMRVWTQQMEKKFSKRNKQWKEIRFAHIVDIITTTSILCWLPITAIRAVVIIWVNFLHVDLKLESHVNLIQWAIWLDWFTPGAITIMLLYSDPYLRSKMFRGDKSENDVVKRYSMESE